MPVNNGSNGNTAVPPASTANASKACIPKDHREREGRDDQSGETSVHQRQAIRPPAAKFEPAPEQRL
jgi:hypothetical protein